MSIQVKCIGEVAEEKISRNSIYSHGKFRAIELNIEAVCKEFYALQAIEATMHTQYGRHSHDKWIQDFYAYKESFESKISEMFRDYLALIVLGELRHCNRYSDKGLSFEFTDFNESISRDKCFVERRYFIKESVFHCGIKLFNELYNGWHESYGGTAWYGIAKSGLMYGKESNTVFIDHCFDLEHNGGCIFNKHAFLFDGPNDIITFLDLKRNAMNTYRIIRHAQTKTLRNLIQRAFNLGILKYDSSRYFRYISDSEAIFNFVIPCELFNFSPSENVYINQFYKENQRLMNTDKWYTLEDLLELYHPFPWGDEDMLQEATIFNTGKKYENGENIYRHQRRRYDDAENY